MEAWATSLYGGCVQTPTKRNGTGPWTTTGTTVEWSDGMLSGFNSKSERLLITAVPCLGFAPRQITEGSFWSGPTAFLQGYQIYIERFYQRQAPTDVGAGAVSGRQAHRASACAVPCFVTGSPGGHAWSDGCATFCRGVKERTHELRAHAGRPCLAHAAGAGSGRAVSQ